MRILVKQAKIIDPNSDFHLQTVDIYIENGTIKEIGNLSNKETDQVIDEPNLHASIGWFDLKANFREPGEEWKETLSTGIEAAKKGGFTEIALSPNTATPIDNRTQIEFIKNRGNHKEINIHPYGALSKELNGKDLAEIADMKDAGAIGFTDDKQHISSSLLSRALLYTKTFNTKVFVFASDKELSKNAQLNEGIVSTKMGLKGFPSIAEEIQINRDIQLSKYHDAPIHFSTISSTNSIELIRKAKQEGLQVTCDVAAHQLYFTDEACNTYDANTKVIPPFRSKQDIVAIIEGLKDGTINAICSDHSPQNIEEKNIEFSDASFGIIGLETLYGSINKNLTGKLSITEIIDKITIAPRSILNMAIPSIAVNHKANLTLFNPDIKWEYNKKDIVSKSKNTPYVGETLIGKAVNTILG